jgi:hypothetical protein
MPATGAALAAGSISADKARLLAAAAKAAPERFSVDEDLMVSAAATRRVDQVRKALEFWVARANPDGATRTHAHHLIHWTDGGPTNRDNLVCLCSRHHHLVHEGNDTITRQSDGHLHVTRPDRTELTVPTSNAPPPHQPWPRAEHALPPKRDRTSPRESALR